MTPGNWWRRRRKTQGGDERLWFRHGPGGRGRIQPRRRRRRIGRALQGQPAAVTDLLGGRIDFVAADLGAVLPQIRARNLNAVALVSAKRSTILSSVPTARELGMGSLDLTGWIGVAGPAA